MPDWQVIIAAAMTRSLVNEPEYSDDQRLTAREAIDAMTSQAAWQSHAENWRGSIAPGMAADFILMESTVDWDDPWSLTENSVASTFVDGQCVHGSAQ